MLTPAPGASLPQGWNIACAAVVVCDMWDAHHCVTAARRVAEMAPRMNEVLGGLRARGALIVHAPGECMDFYARTPARLRAVHAPLAPAPYAVDWHTWEPTSWRRCRRPSPPRGCARASLPSHAATPPR